MKRPFLSVASFYAVGILAGSLLAVPLLTLFAASFAVLAFALLFARFRPLLLALLLLFAGWTNLRLRTAVLAPDDLRHLLGPRPEIVTLRGALIQSPRVTILQRRDRDIERSLALVRVAKIQRKNHWQPASGKLIVATPAPLGTNYFSGEPIQVFGVIARPPAPLAPGLFDYRNYLAVRGIYFELKTGSVADWRLPAPHPARPPMNDRFMAWAHRALAAGLPPDQSQRLLRAMSLGWRTAFTGDVGDPFLRAGTMHLFAIDGLRIALLAAMFVAVLRAVRLSRAWCGALAAPLIWFYTAATGWEPSAVRASIMMSIVLAGWALKRPVDLLNSLAAAAFVILLCDPRQLFEAGFQLSFLVMLAIALILPPLNGFCERLLANDPLLPADLVPKWRRLWTGAALWLARFASVSFAAWIGCIPLAAKYFHLFSPVSTIANVAAIPLGALALMAELGSLACAAWLPPLAILFNNAAWFLMLALTDASQWFASLPGAWFYVPAPSWTSIAIYYLALVALFGGCLATRKRQLLAATVFLSIAAIYLWRWDGARHETQLTVLPLAAGHCVFLQDPGNDWLVDCGSADDVQFTLKSFLRSRGVNHLPQLVLTEGASRNCSGAPALDALFGINRLWTSSAAFRSAPYNKILAAFDQPPRRRIFTPGHPVGPWLPLWPPPAPRPARADDNALVLLGNFGGAKILLLSDLGSRGQDALLAARPAADLRADVVIAGLPARGEPLRDPLLDAIHPRLIVIADSPVFSERAARARLKARLRLRNVPVIYTRDSGAVTITLRPSGWSARSMDGIQLRP